MLRSEHRIVEYDFDRMKVRPDRLRRGADRHYLATAERLIEIYRAGVGNNIRQELHRQATEVLENLGDCTPRRAAAFCKLLDDLSEYRTAKNSAKLRKRVFEFAANRHPIVQRRDAIFETGRAEIERELERELKMPFTEIESALFADVIELQTLESFDEQISARDLLSIYNVAQCQACLYRATHLRIIANDHLKAIVRAIKLAGLMHRISRRPDESASGPKYLFELDGPTSSLRETSRYGIRFAKILSTLVRCKAWSLQARVLGHRDQVFRFDLSQRDGLRLPGDAPDEFDSVLESEVDAIWQKKPIDGWRWGRESELLVIDQTVTTPDFVLTRESDGLMIHIEVVGYWTPEYMQEKAARLRKLLNHDDHRQRRWLLMIPDDVRSNAMDTLESLGLPIIGFRKSMNPTEWVEKAVGSKP